MGEEVSCIEKMEMKRLLSQSINHPTIALESEHQWVHHGLCEKIGNAAVVSGKELSGARSALSKGLGEEEED